jgi:asparagine synthase (glutamine-hydrolysing)
VSAALAARLAPGRPPEAPHAGGTERTLCLLDGRVTNLEELGGGEPEHALASGYERWGEDVVRRAEGQFALLLWDRAQGHGLAARDPLGHRSIYFRVSGDGVVLASELRHLLALLPATPAPDEVAVAHWLARTGVPVGRTLYDGVERLAPGHVLRLGRGRPAAVPAWRPATAGARGPDARDAPTYLREAMAGAVRRAAQGAERCAVLLSGGFDSGSVAALAGAPVAYSAVFPDHPDVDESAGIAATRDALGLRGVEQRFAGGSALGAALEFLLAHRVPSASPNGFVWRPLVRRAAADGITTVLDGEGGDELLGCAPFLIADALRGGRPVQALRLARRLPGMGEAPRARWIARALRRYGARGALPVALHVALRRRRGSPGPGAGWLQPRLERVHRETHDPWAWKREPGPRWRASLLHTVIDRSEALGAHEQFRLEAELCGVEFRHPFRDPALLEAVLRLDPALAFDPGLDRPLARAAMEGLLPDRVRLADRKPHFNPLLQAALGVRDATAVRALLGDPRAEVRAYLRADALDGRLAGDLGRLEGRALLELWQALTIECWLRLPGERERLEALATGPG